MNEIDVNALYFRVFLSCFPTSEEIEKCTNCGSKPNLQVGALFTIKRLTHSNLNGAKDDIR